MTGRVNYKVCLILFLATAFLISVPIAFADPNLIGWWEFDEGSGSTAYDSASGNNGAITGAAWFDDPCQGMCLSFDGDKDYVTVGDKADLEQQAFTLSFWAQLNNPSGTLQGGIAKGYIFGSVAEFSYKIDFDSGYVWPAITNTSDTAFGIIGPIGNSGWHMWSMTVGGGTLTLYKDGSFVNSTGYTGTIDYAKSQNNFVIGARDNGRYAFNGEIDDVRFYDSTLSAGEIWQLYLEGLGLTASNPIPADEATGVDPDVVLSWSAGYLADSHDVYFGTSYNGVNNANTSSPEYKGNFDVNTFAPLGLDLATIYYWRIDEVNNPNVWKGDVWSFKTIGPVIGLSTTQFEFYALEGGENPADQILSISNNGVGTLNWQISEGCGWLSVEPNRGSSTGEADDVNLMVDTSGLVAGIYTCNLTISDPNASNNPQTASITLRLSNNGTLNVPSEYSTIQAAIDAALYGDVVIVAPGTYTGPENRNIDLKGKAITVQSKNGPDDCIIDCNGSQGYRRSGFCIYQEEDANTIIDGFTIVNGNRGSNGEGGGAFDLCDASPTIKNCCMFKNMGVNGGAILCVRSNARITNCIIVDNYAWSGSGIFCNNSIDQCPGPRNGGPEISNCLFVGNIARMGGFAQVGTLYCYNSDTLIRNCTLANNNYGIFVLQGDVEINNCILQNENYEIETPDWYWPTVNVANCLIRDFKIHKGDNSIIRLNGNINADPCFISTDANDYHLNPASPCINAGNPNFIPEPNETDIDGELRLMLGRVDMGADEFNPFEIDFTVVNKRRVGRTLFEYDCVVTLTNVSRFAVRNVALEIIKAPENMVLIDPAVTFGDIEIGPDETATSLDMCTFRVDRSYATDPAEIIWKSTCEIVDGVPGAQVIASGISFLNLGIIPGDITGNGKVDFYDLAILADQWLQPPGSPSADIAPFPTGDGFVDFLDFSLLADNWLKGSGD